jgi:GNAT superfamily N-acetyltransferase
MDIQELKSADEWRAAFPVMRELRPDLSEAEFLRLREIMARDGYRLFAARRENKIVALAGIAVLTNLAYGRHVWVYDLVTTGAARSQGYGQRLLDFIEELARRENCRCVALSSGLQRTDAHRFYEQRMKYNKTSFVFRKSLC